MAVGILYVSGDETMGEKRPIHRRTLPALSPLGVLVPWDQVILHTNAAAMNVLSGFMGLSWVMTIGSVQAKMSRWESEPACKVGLLQGGAAAR